MKDYLGGYVQGYEDCNDEFSRAIPEEASLEQIVNAFITLLHIQRKSIAAMRENIDFDECLDCYEEFCDECAEAEVDYCDECEENFEKHGFTVIKGGKE